MAWNEAAHIGGTIQAFFEQTLLCRPPADIESVEFTVVANGCTDDTVAAAQAAFDACMAKVGDARVHCKAADIKMPGKSNAWNCYVHEISDPGADYLFLADADIWFRDPDAMCKMVEALKADPDADVAVDMALKDILFKEKKSLVERISATRSAIWTSGPPVLCGHLYCARASALRAIWLPTGLFLEDQFLNMMVVTKSLGDVPRETRVIRAADASHVFGAYTSMREIFGHELSMAIGSVVNAMLYDHLLRLPLDTDRAAYIRSRNEEDPDWLAKLIQNWLAEQPYWVMPSPFSLRRFRRLSGVPLSQLAVRAPVALMATILDAAVFIAGNRAIRKGRRAVSWEKVRDARAE